MKSQWNIQTQQLMKRNASHYQRRGNSKRVYRHCYLTTDDVPISRENDEWRCNARANRTKWITLLRAKSEKRETFIIIQSLHNRKHTFRDLSFFISFPLPQTTLFMYFHYWCISSQVYIKEGEKVMDVSYERLTHVVTVFQQFCKFAKLNAYTILIA